MISASMLSAYLYCKRKLFIERVLKIIEPEKKAVILGKIRHLIFDRTNEEEEKIIKSIEKPMSKFEIIETYKKNYTKIAKKIIFEHKNELKKINVEMINCYKDVWKSLLQEIEFRADIVHDFLSREKVFGTELFEKITPKIKSEKYFESEKLNIKGIIDKLEVFEDYLIPVELKTGKFPKEGVWPGHMIQIGTYMLLLEENGKKVPHGIVYYLDAGEKREIFMNPFLKEEIKELTDKVQKLLNEKKIPDFCTESAKCNVCGLKKSCYAENYIEQKLKELELPRTVVTEK
jgi:CRISPR-associated protein Cas4